MKILLVEDDTFVSRLILDMFRLLGQTEITHTRSAEIAYGMLGEEQEPFDLILSDNRTLGSMTGLELLRLLRGNPRTASQRFILMSGDTYSEGRPLHETCEELNSRFVPKPIQMDKLKELLN